MKKQISTLRAIGYVLEAVFAVVGLYAWMILLGVLLGA